VVRSVVLVGALYQLHRRRPADGRRGTADTAPRSCHPHTDSRAAADDGRTASTVEDLLLQLTGETDGRPTPSGVQTIPLPGRDSDCMAGIEGVRVKTEGDEHVYSVIVLLSISFVTLCFMLYSTSRSFILEYGTMH